ncbi:carboxyltransferase domain-containing protein [Nesterenkonia sp. PF2B19]|uniref:carboxyltransferase domain-containing protein n=1 Tax=Nesterenkonia sp. PF2B19 TaxID=1881858 RepID=UPI0008732ABD|nr:carboxyltransferase domain-containing protein [Nesterenkonia sp. PF2B19]
MTAPILGVRDAGPRALLLEFDGLDDVLAHHQHLSRHPLPGQREAVAAARTLLLRFDAPGATREARDALGGLTVAAFSAEAPRWWSSRSSTTARTSPRWPAGWA